MGLRFLRDPIRYLLLVPSQAQSAVTLRGRSAVHFLFPDIVKEILNPHHGGNGVLCVCICWLSYTQPVT